MSNEFFPGVTFECRRRPPRILAGIKRRFSDKGDFSSSCKIFPALFSDVIGLSSRLCTRLFLRRIIVGVTYARSRIRNKISRNELGKSFTREKRMTLERNEFSRKTCQTRKNNRNQENSRGGGKIVNMFTSLEVFRKFAR